MKMDEIEKKHFAYALTAVLLDEYKEEPNVGFEEMDKICTIFEKLCDILDEEELKTLAMVRPITFNDAMDELEEIDKVFDELEKIKKTKGDKE
jgi:hypothetical protein